MFLNLRGQKPGLRSAVRLIVNAHLHSLDIRPSRNEATYHWLVTFAIQLEFDPHGLLVIVGVPSSVAAPFDRFELLENADQRVMDLKATKEPSGTFPRSKAERYVFA